MPGHFYFSLVHHFMQCLLISFSYFNESLSSVDFILVIKTKAKIGQNRDILVLVLIN